MTKINVLSLFDGMSCGQIALEKLGIEVENYFASEIDKYAMQVTKHNYTNTKQLGNVVDVIAHIFNQMAAIADKERGEEKKIITV